MTVSLSKYMVKKCFTKTMLLINNVPAKFLRKHRSSGSQMSFKTVALKNFAIEIFLITLQVLLLYYKETPTQILYPQPF